MSDPEIRDTTWLCDACISRVPETRYSIPVGTPVSLEIPGAPLMLSAGSFGLCGPCRKILDGGLEAGRLLAERTFRENARLRSVPHGERRDAIRRLYRRHLERLLPLLTNPRPAVRGEEPLDGKEAWFGGAP